MIRRKIELAEIIVIGLDIRAFRDRKAHIGEDRREFIGDLADRMEATEVERADAGRQRHVEGLGGEPGFERGRFQSGAPLAERRRHLILHEIDRRALVLARLGRQFAEAGEQRRDRAFLAESGDAHRLQRRFVGGRFDGGERFPFKR